MPIVLTIAYTAVPTAGALLFNFLRKNGNGYSGTFYGKRAIYGKYGRYDKNTHGKVLYRGKKLNKKVGRRSHGVTLSV